MARLGDLYQITSGGTPSRKHLDYYQDGTIPWVKTGDLKEKYLRATDEKITEIGLKNSSARIYPKDTVLIAMYGATISTQDGDRRLYHQSGLHRAKETGCCRQSSCCKHHPHQPPDQQHRAFLRG